MIPAISGDIEALSASILEEARAETEQLSNNARSKAEVIRQRAQAEAERERSSILDHAAVTANRLRGQALATAQLKARAMELEHREALLHRVFTAVTQELKSIPKRKDYENIVQNLVQEGLTQLQTTEVEIRADRTTQDILTKAVLEKISEATQVKLSIGKTLEKGTGVILQTVDGHLHFDNTFETRLFRLQGTLRAAVYHVLMGEKV